MRMDALQLEFAFPLRDYRSQVAETPTPSTRPTRTRTRFHRDRRRHCTDIARSRVFAPRSAQQDRPRPANRQDFLRRKAFDRQAISRFQRDTASHSSEAASPPGDRISESCATTTPVEAVDLILVSSRDVQGFSIWTERHAKKNRGQRNRLDHSPRRSVDNLYPLLSP